MRYIILIIISILFINCQNGSSETVSHVEQKLPDTEFHGWWHKDLALDSLPGISLDKAYTELIKQDSGEEVIVAIIDSPVDIDHEDLKNQIYTNPNEIPDNGKDDDNNGFIDDIHGWNFLGYGKKNSVQFANYDYLRIIRRLEPLFKEKDSSSIKQSEQREYQKYLNAKKLMEADVDDIEGELEYHKKELANFLECIELFPEAYSKEEKVFDKKILDTLTPKSDRQKELLEDLQDFAYYGFYPELLESYVKQGEARKAKCSNLEYNERNLIGDDIYNLNDIKGNGFIDSPIGRITHGTQVASAIAATRNNRVGVRGVSNKIKLMMLVVFPERGDELDKDVSNAIHYAVDNGAKVINYSHGKYYADKENYITEALKYANSKGVLLISAAGNTPVNIDNIKDSPFPKDNPDNENEIVSNLIKVGASGRSIKKVKPSWSSYGKENVDFFAPGQRIMTTNSGSHKYFELGGSSLSSAITSGVAALIFSQYPNLSAKQVKTILMQSGTLYDQEIKINEDISLNFQELSKSGRVLNAYNALKMAKEISEASK